MRKQTNLCQKEKIYIGSQSPKYQEKLRNARLYNNDKNIIRLPRHYFTKGLTNTAMARDSGAFRKIK